MIKTARNLLLALALTTGLNAATELNKDEIKKIENLDLFKGVNIKVNKAYDTESLYLLKVNVRGKIDEIYLTKDKKYLIAGDVMDTKTGAKLSVPADLSIAKGNQAFTFGKGNDEYYLFTDPECPYCKKFESYLAQVEDKVKINVFYFPLDFHANAKDISLYVMSQDSYKDKVNAMVNTTKDTPAFKNRKIDAKKLKSLEAKLDKQIAIGQELGVQGTPAVFDKDGNKVNWVQMLQSYGIEVK